MVPPFVRLTAGTLLAAPLLVACGSTHDDAPTPNAASTVTHEQVRLAATAAKGKHYCADFRASNKRPKAVHVANCGKRRFGLTYEGHGSKVKPGKKSWLKLGGDSYHGLTVVMTGAHDQQVGTITLG